MTLYNLLNVLKGNYLVELTENNELSISADIDYLRKLHKNKDARTSMQIRDVRVEAWRHWSGEISPKLYINLDSNRKA